MSQQPRQAYETVDAEGQGLFRRTVTLFEEEPMKLDLGGTLSPVTVAYETYGQLNRQRDNAILVVHALTGDAHPARHAPDDPDPGWWEGMVGPNDPIDTNRWFVICSNVLGGCRGTTGPGSTNPATGRPYALDFPQVTVGDMVRVQRALLDELGVPRLHAVIGGSLGGMQAMQWAVQYPDDVDLAIPLGSPGRTSAQSIAYNEVMRSAIMLDPEWCDGFYEPGQGPRRGLHVARMLGMITYQSNPSMDRKFGRDPVIPARQGDLVFGPSGRPGEADSERHAVGMHYEIESYLHYQGDKLVHRFDANTYLYLTRAADLFDLGLGWPSYEDALQRIRARVVVVSIDTDILYPPYQQREMATRLATAGVDVELRELHSPWGHDAFLLEFDQLRMVLEGVL